MYSFADNWTVGSFIWKLTVKSGPDDQTIRRVLAENKEISIKMLRNCYSHDLVCFLS